MLTRRKMGGGMTTTRSMASNISALTRCYDSVKIARDAAEKLVVATYVWVAALRAGEPTEAADAALNLEGELYDWMHDNPDRVAALFGFDEEGEE